MRVLELGIPLGRIQSGSRQQSDGSILAWQLTDPYALPYSGVFPFLIDWGTTPHPGTRLPQVGRLDKLVIEHAESKILQAHFKNLDIRGDIQHGQKARLEALIEVKHQKIKLPGLVF